MSKTVLVAVEVPDNVSPEQVRTLVERAALHRWGLYADDAGRPRVAAWETEQKLGTLSFSEAVMGLTDYLMELKRGLKVRMEQEARRLTVVPDGDVDKGGDEG